MHGTVLLLQNYVEDLERLNIFFLAPLRKLAGTPGEVLPAAQVNTIFGTVDQLVRTSSVNSVEHFLVPRTTGEESGQWCGVAFQIDTPLCALRS